MVGVPQYYINQRFLQFINFVINSECAGIVRNAFDDIDSPNSIKVGDTQFIDLMLILAVVANKKDWIEYFLDNYNPNLNKQLKDKSTDHSSSCMFKL